LHIPKIKEYPDLVLEAKKISKLLIKAFDDVGRIGLIMEGTGVDHAHIKLIPLHGTEHMKKGEWKQYLSGKEDYYPRYEGYISSHDGPQADFNKIALLAKKIKSYK
jgi:diadenosine tetraphosphate (Ap4A) HIT family hydrolase